MKDKGLSPLILRSIQPCMLFKKDNILPGICYLQVQYLNLIFHLMVEPSEIVTWAKKGAGNRDGILSKVTNVILKRNKAGGVFELYLLQAILQ